GSVVGGWIGRMIGVNTDAYLVGWVFAILGGILLLIIYHAVTNPRLRGTDTTTNRGQDFFNPMDRRQREVGRDLRLLPGQRRRTGPAFRRCGRRAEPYTYLDRITKSAAR